MGEGVGVVFGASVVEDVGSVVAEGIGSVVRECVRFAEGKAPYVGK